MHGFEQFLHCPECDSRIVTFVRKAYARTPVIGLTGKGELMVIQQPDMRPSKDEPWLECKSCHHEWQPESPYILHLV